MIGKAKTQQKLIENLASEFGKVLTSLFPLASIVHIIFNCVYPLED